MPPQTLYFKNVVNWAVLYSSLIMVTLLWCTILIIYRIVRVDGAAGRTRVYQRLIEMLVESVLLYSATIAILLVLQVHNDGAGLCVEVVAIAIRVCLIRFDFFFLMTTASLLGNCAYNFGRPRLQQDMCAQRTPGVEVPQCHRFDSEVIQVHRMTAKWALDLNRTHLRAQGRTWKRAWKGSTQK